MEEVKVVGSGKIWCCFSISKSNPPHDDETEDFELEDANIVSDG